MSSTNKTVIGVIVVIAVLGVYYWYVQSHKLPAPESAAQTQTTSTANDTSSEALVQDSAAIDAQLSGLSSDNASMNSSDQVVTQSY